MTRDRLHFLFINLGHFFDHLFILIFATVAALALVREWGVSYAELLRYATPSFFVLGLCAYPAGWLADKWNADGMMVVFFGGTGLASIATAFATSPLQISIGLCVISVFASIYHPVGLAIVSRKWRDLGMRLAINNVWGNLGVASAALITGYMIDHAGWRVAFVAPGIFSIALGLTYLATQWHEIATPAPEARPAAAHAPGKGGAAHAERRDVFLRVSVIVFLTTVLANFIFQSTTFSLPKIFDERLVGLTADFSAWMQTTPLAGSADIATLIGSFTFLVFALSSLSQLAAGYLLDRAEARTIYGATAVIQVTFFALMAHATDLTALAAALCFMVGVFGQGPINDFMISRVATGTMRARLYGARFVVAFLTIATTLPIVSFIYEGWGFAMLFYALTVAAAAILALVMWLPKGLSATA